MSTETMTAVPDRAIPVRAHNAGRQAARALDSDRQFDVRASRGSVVLDLRSPQIAAGDIEISLDIDHAVVKLLVPDGAVIDDGDTRRIGRCRIKDWTGISAADGRADRAQRRNAQCGGASASRRGGNPVGDVQPGVPRGRAEGAPRGPVPDDR